MHWCSVSRDECPILLRPDSRTYRDERGFPSEFLPAPGYDYSGVLLVEPGKGPERSLKCLRI